MGVQLKWHEFNLEQKLQNIVALLHATYSSLYHEMRSIKLSTITCCAIRSSMTITPMLMHKKSLVHSSNKQHVLKICYSWYLPAVTVPETANRCFMTVNPQILPTTGLVVYSTLYCTWWVQHLRKENLVNTCHKTFDFTAGD